LAPDEAGYSGSLYPRGKNPLHPWERRLGGPRGGEEKEVPFLPLVKYVTKSLLSK